MAVKFEKRESKFGKRVGLFAGIVVAINPDNQGLKDIGAYVKDATKEPEYIGKTQDGDKKLKVSIWTKDAKTGWLSELRINLIDKVNVSKNNNTQYINSRGRSTYVDDIKNLPDWFTKDGATYQEAHIGEAEFLDFILSWLNIDTKKPYVMELDWKSVLKGNLSDFTQYINTDMANSVLLLATVSSKEDEESGEVKEYQNIYNRRFLPGYNLKYVTNTLSKGGFDLEELKRKSNDPAEKSELTPLDRYLLQIMDEEYGIKDFFGGICLLKEYNATENVVASSEAKHDSDDPGFN